MKRGRQIKIGFFIIIFSLFVGAIFLTANSRVLAQANPVYEIPNPFGVKTLEEVVQKIATWLLAVMTPVAVIMILYAAFLFMTSAGNEEKIKTAKRTLTWALVGLAIMIIGGGFVYLIQNLLSQSGTSTPGNNTPVTDCSAAAAGDPCTKDNGSQGNCQQGAIGSYGLSCQ